MPDIEFEVGDVRATGEAAASSLVFELRLVTDAPVETMLLQCQLQIEAPRRRYSPEEKASLGDLFGEPERWSQTMRSIPWASAQVSVPPFARRATCPVSVPCSFDLYTGPGNFFRALIDGAVPLSLMFRGTIFYRSESGDLHAQPLSWSKEAKVMLATATWRDMLSLCAGEQLETACRSN